MSSQAHLHMLGEGVDAWNRWRKASPGVRPDLSEVDLRGGDYSGIDFTTTHLEKADLSEVRLGNAGLRGASLPEAKLVNADLTGADLRGADLTGALVDGVTYDRRMKCLGTRVDLCTGNPRFIRHVLETDYIEAFSAEHPFLSSIWGLTSCHSRSFARVGLVAVAFVFFFSLLYWIAPGMIHWSDATHSKVTLPWLQSFYYSAAVFTTVGASTIYPRSPSGEFVTMIEVILGYIWLGYLVSILAQRATARF